MQKIEECPQTVKKISPIAIYKKTILLLAAALLPQLSWASTCSTTACRAPIVRLYLNGTSVLVELGLTESQKAALNCTLVDGLYFSLTDDNAGRKEIYAALLSAQARAADVTLRFIENSANCKITWVMSWS